MTTIQTIKGTLRITPTSLSISNHQYRFNVQQRVYLIFLYRNQAAKTIPIRLASRSSLAYKWQEEEKYLELKVDSELEEVVEVAVMSFPSDCVDSLPIVLSRASLNLSRDDKFLNIINKHRSNVYHLDMGNVGVLDLLLQFKSEVPCLPPKIQSISHRNLPTNDNKAESSPKEDLPDAENKLKIDPNVIYKVYDTEIKGNEQKHKHFKTLRRAKTFLRNNHRKWRENLHYSNQYGPGSDDESTFEANITSIEHLNIKTKAAEEEVTPRNSLTLSPNPMDSTSPTESNFSKHSSISTSSNVPYSAASIGLYDENFTPLLATQQENPTPPKPIQLSPQTYRLITSLSEGQPPSSFFQTLIQPGLSEYKGDSQWGKNRLRDSMINMNESLLKSGDQRGVPPPNLPPKVPVGLTKQEWFVLKRQDVVNYVKGLEPYNF